MGEEVVAFSATCTHAGCTVRFKEGAFHCPCHGGVFSLDGEPVKGPVERPLERLEARIVGDQVEVKV